MDAELLRIVESRIQATRSGDEDWAALVLAACDGEAALADALSGEKRKRTASTARTAKPGPETPGAYLSSVTVEGFRGVGPSKTLELTPGPGLTLVIGRNGSGKSSFAEALEILLTGSNWRWQYRSMIWKEGWRNLHHPSPTEVSAEFAVEGEKGATTIKRTWADSAELDDNEPSVNLPSKRTADLDSLGWASALESYRPFLSYNELGSMFDEGPTKLHDRLSKILGLGDLDYSEGLLRKARLELEGRVKLVKNSLPALLAELQQSTMSALSERWLPLAVGSGTWRRCGERLQTTMEPARPLTRWQFCEAWRRSRRHPWPRRRGSRSASVRRQRPPAS